jgi:ABC-2 type transport system ATP-binding protein
MAATYRLNGWEDRANHLLARFELGEKRNTLAAELSRGMRQKVAICCGYLHEPKAILLDEPMTGLDPHGIRTMKDSIREQAAAGAAIIISSHLLSLFEDLISSVLILHHGRQLLHAKLAELSHRISADGRHETLEDLFFRLTETATPAEAQPVQET